jgi:DNA-binding response OmpR family regulator
VDESTTPVPAAVSPAGRARGARASGVLVVDDNADAATSLALLLEAQGYRADVEHEPAPALRRVLEDPPDACILDIGLPDMDGRELARRIRAGLGERTPLLIALTGYGSNADRRAALDAGFDHYLVKPADIQQLEALLASSQASLG